MSRIVGRDSDRNFCGYSSLLAGDGQAEHVSP